MLVEERHDAPYRVHRLLAHEAKRRRARVDQVLIDEGGRGEQDASITDRAVSKPECVLRALGVGADQGEGLERLGDAAVLDPDVN